jgi:hypothetical protein
MRHLTTIVAILLVSSSAAVAQAQEQKRPDPEVIEDKTPAAPMPVYSGATVNIIRNLKSQQYSIQRTLPEGYERVGPDKRDERNPLHRFKPER